MWLTCIRICLFFLPDAADGTAWLGSIQHPKTRLEYEYFLIVVCVLKLFRQEHEPDLDRFLVKKTDDVIKGCGLNRFQAKSTLDEITKHCEPVAFSAAYQNTVHRRSPPFHQITQAPFQTQSVPGRREHHCFAKTLALMLDSFWEYLMPSSRERLPRRSALRGSYFGTLFGTLAGR